MADFPERMSYPWQISYIGPETLVTKFEDGGEIRRAKAASGKRIFEGETDVNATDCDTIWDLWIAKGLATTFTLTTYDAHEAGGTTATVVFDVPPVFQFIALGTWRITLRFREV